MPPNADVVATIGEEIGHALTEGNGHGARWKDMNDRVMRLLLEMDGSIPRSPTWYLRHAGTVS